MTKERIEPTTFWLGNTKKFQAPARVRTHDLLAGKAISEVHFTQWSGDKVEFWQNLFKKRVTDHDFPHFSPLKWAENNKKRCRTAISFVCCYSKTLSRGTIQGKINFSTENVTKNFFEKTSHIIQNTEKCYPSGKKICFFNLETSKKPALVETA